MSNHNHICQNPSCRKEFEAKRSDAKFCSEACKKTVQRLRKKDFQKREEEKEKSVAPLKAEIKELGEMNLKLRSVLEFQNHQFLKPFDQDLEALDKLTETWAERILEVDIQDWQKAFILPNLLFYNLIINKNVHCFQKHKVEDEPWIDFILKEKYPKHLKSQILSNWVVAFPPQKEYLFLKEIAFKRAQIPGIIKKLKEKLRLTTQKRLANQKVRKPYPPAPHVAKECQHLKSAKKKIINSLIQKNTFKILELEKQIKSSLAKESEAVVPKQAAPKRIFKKKQNAGQGYAPGELRNMKFDLLDLSGQGELGAFLGNLESKMLAIALIGDPTAGKTTFSFRLAKLFLDIGLSVKYFSLEEGVTSLTQDKLDRAGIENTDPFEIIGTGTLQEVRKAAKKWDVVVLDSWSVLDEKSDEYQKLRSNFPDTIFIVIFQKTTTGSIRGGSKIIYDTPVCMNVSKVGKNRFAEMQKSRYGTQGWKYSITYDELIEEED